jgi:hypothetical protein
MLKPLMKEGAVQLMLVCVLTFTGCTLGKSEMNTKPRPTVSLEIVATKLLTTRSAGIEIVLSNASPVSVGAKQGPSGHACVLMLTTSDGVPVPYTELGRMKVAPREIESAWHVPLPSGHSIKWDYELHALFDLKPGAYILTAIAHITPPVALSTPRLTAPISEPQDDSSAIKSVPIPITVQE